MTVHVDASAWPLVAVRFGRHRTKGELEPFLSESASILDREQRHGMVVDLTEVDELDARQRQLIAEWTREHSIELREFRLAHCVIVKDAVQRGIVTAIDWLTPPPYPSAVVTSPIEASEWVTQRLVEAGALAPGDTPR